MMLKQLTQPLMMFNEHMVLQMYFLTSLVRTKVAIETRKLAAVVLLVSAESWSVLIPTPTLVTTVPLIRCNHWMISQDTHLYRKIFF